MVWVFGIVFLTLVVIFAGSLYKSSSENREKLAAMPRKRRVTIGVVASLLSFAAAFVALLVASGVTDWNHPSIISLIGTMVLMLFFVVLQVGAMLCFVSVVTESETK